MPPVPALASLGFHASQTLLASLLLASPERPLPLTHVVNAYACFSPDGSKIVYQSSAAGQFDLHEIRRDGSGIRVLVASPANDITPVYSPDGTKIAFVSEREGNREIYVAGSDGSNPVNLTRHPASDIHPVWSKDGERILFSSSRTAVHPDDFDIFEMRADGTGVRQITRGPDVDTYASWSPDGSRIVTRRVVDGNSEVFVLDRDGGGAKNLTNAPGDYDGWPAWSPDGSRIAYAGGGPDFGNHYVFLVRPDGTDRVQVTFAEPGSPFCYDTQPAFSPNGEWLAFTRYRPTHRHESAEICLVRVPKPA
jgi:TolB protein